METVIVPISDEITHYTSVQTTTSRVKPIASTSITTVLSDADGMENYFFKSREAFSEINFDDLFPGVRKCHSKLQTWQLANLIILENFARAVPSRATSRL